MNWKIVSCGVAVGLVLPDGIAPGLAGHRVLQFGGDDRHAVEADDQIDRVLACEAVLELAGDGEAVRLVEGSGRGVHAVGRGEIGEVELLAVALEAVAQDVERAAGGEGAEQIIQDGGLVCVPSRLSSLAHAFGWESRRKVNSSARSRASSRSKRVGVAREIAAFGEQALLDGGLEGDLLVIDRHQLASLGVLAHVDLAGDGGSD